MADDHILNAMGKCLFYMPNKLFYAMELELKRRAAIPPYSDRELRRSRKEKSND